MARTALDPEGEEQMKGGEMPLGPRHLAGVSRLLVSLAVVCTCINGFIMGWTVVNLVGVAVIAACAIVVWIAYAK